MYVAMSSLPMSELPHNDASFQCLQEIIQTCQSVAEVIEKNCWLSWWKTFPRPWLGVYIYLFQWIDIDRPFLRDHFWAVFKHSANRDSIETWAVLELSNLHEWNSSITKMQLEMDHVQCYKGYNSIHSTGVMQPRLFWPSVFKAATMLSNHGRRLMDCLHCLCIGGIHTFKHTCYDCVCSMASIDAHELVC